MPERSRGILAATAPGDDVPPWSAYPEAAGKPDAGSLSWLLWRPVALDRVLSGEDTIWPPSVLARDDGVRLFYPGRLNSAAGETESLKSWLCAVATCQEIAGGRHVVWLDYEDTAATLVDRLRALGATDSDIAGRVTYYESPPSLDDVARELVGEVFAERGAPSLVVLDGVTEAMTASGLDPYVGADVVRFYTGTPRWFKESGAAVALVDHVTKDREGRGRWAIGSERKLSGLDGAGYTLDVIQPFGRGKTGKAKVTVSKDRLGYVREHEGSGRIMAMLELRSWPDGKIGYSLAAPKSTDDGAFRPTSLMEKLSRAVEEHPGLSKTSLRAAVGGKAEYVDLALELLKTEGYVTAESGPRGAHQHVSARAYRESLDGVDDDPI